MKKKTFQVKISPISSLNDSETQEKDFGVLKSKKVPKGERAPESQINCTAT